MHRARKVMESWAVTAAMVAAMMLCSVRHAGAAPSEQELERARALFAEGRKLEDSGHWAKALDLFQQIAKVKMTPQVRFHIALCMENLGLWTQALEGYLVSAREADPDAPDVLKEAREHIAFLQEKIPILTIETAGTGQEDALVVDGKQVPIEVPPRTLRVNPGRHTVEIRRGERVVGRADVVLEPGSSRRLSVKVDAPAQEGGRDGRTQRILGYSTLGLGAAAAVSTGVFIGLRAGALKDLQANCPAFSGCDPSIEPVVSDGKTYATLVNIMASLTGACIVGGTVLVLTAPAASSPSGARAQRSWQLSIAAAPHSPWIALGGTF